MPPLDPLPFRLALPGRETVDLTGVTSIGYKVKGLLHVDGNTITLEWAAVRTTQAVSLLDVVDEVDYSPIASVALRASWIAEARVTGWWWAPRFRLRARQLEALGRIPGAQGDVLTLRLRRRDRRHAQALAAAIASAGGWGR